MNELILKDENTITQVLGGHLQETHTSEKWDVTKVRLCELVSIIKRPNLDQRIGGPISSFYHPIYPHNILKRENVEKEKNYSFDPNFILFNFNYHF